MLRCFVRIVEVIRAARVGWKMIILCVLSTIVCKAGDEKEKQSKEKRRAVEID